MFLFAYRNTEAGAVRPAKARPTGRREALQALSLEWNRKQAEKAAIAAAEAQEKADRLVRLRESAIERLWRVIPSPPPKNLDTVRALVAHVGLWHGYTLADILGPSRVRPLIQARFDAIAAIRHNHPAMSSTAIGSLLNRDHTTILSALRRRGLR